MPQDDYSQIAPHAVEQALVIKHLNERFACWKSAVHDIQDLLKETEGLEKELDRAYGNTMKKLDSKDEQFGQSVAPIFQPLKVQYSNQDYSLQMHTLYDSVHSKTDVQVMKRLKLLKSQLSTKSGEFSKALQKAQHNVELARENAKREMTKYEKEEMTRKRDHIAPTPPTSQSDPWLDSKLVWEKINMLISEENTYQESMRHLFTEIGTFDNQIAEELNLVLVEHNILRKEHYSNLLVQLFLKQQTTRPDALEPSKKQDYFETFSVAHGLKHEGLWNTPMKAENFPFHAPEVKIYKQGIVYRRSVIGLGWEPVLLVLTESGFLHQFEMKKDKQVVKHYKTQEANRDVTSGTLHRGRESCEIDQNILDDTHKPSLSISLAHPRITIQPASKKNDISAFEICIVKRREGFTKFLSKDKDVAVTYEYKCLSEPDMVEWIAFLQKVTSKLFPQNPPKPLFKSADKIEETVEEMIKQQSFSRSTSSELNAQGSKGKESIQANEEQKNAQVAESDKPGPARDLSATTMTEAPHVAAVEVIIPVQSPESRS